MPGFASGRTLVRALVSLLVSLALALLLWSLRPRELGYPIDVVGYPTFHNFNYHPIFWAWRILVWQVPLVALATYAVLMRFGPLRHPGPARSTQRPDRPSLPPRSAGVLSTWVAALAVPATLVWYAVSLLPDTAGGGWTRPGLYWGMGYAVGVAALSLAWWAASRRRGPDAPGPTARLTVVSAVLGVLLGTAVLVVASRRTIVVNGDASITHWPWLPWWLAAVGLAAGLVWVVRRLRGGLDPVEVERLVRTWFLGTVLVLAVTLYLPPAIAYFEGFDDAQSVMGAELLSEGYFPWRDFMFIHGLFEDGLRSWVGWGIFEPSIWGGGASYSMVFAPAYFVGLYWLTAYASRRGSVVPAGLVVLAASFELPVSTRWFLIGLVFVLLAEAIRRRSPRWTAGLTALLFVAAVLAPEVAFQVLACFAVLLFSDLTHRERGVAWWRALPLVRAFVVTGAALSVLLLAFLAVVGALSDFIGYYLYFGPGHVESGAVPILPEAPDFHLQSMVVLGAAIAGTLLVVGLRLLHGYPVTPLQWTTLAAALMTGAYGEKALGRFDGGHILQNLAVAAPFYLLIAAGITGALDDVVRRGVGRLTRRRPRTQRFALRTLAQPAACLLVVALVWQLNASAVKLAPGRLHMYAAVPITDPRVGYQYPDALDTALLDDIDRVLDTYAGDDGKIFDFTNSPGFLYYLIDREPAIPFVHISMAVVERAQQAVVDQLAEARPRVVVFDNTRFGIAAWDGPRAEVRHFEVAQYLLDHWSPVVAADGLLFLVRNDLLADAPEPPELDGGEPDTTDLYFSQPTCDWGYSANYLESEPSGASVELPVRTVGGFGIVANGWAYDAASDEPVDDVVIAVGDRVVGRMTPDAPRPDVATNLGLPEADRTGFSGTVVFEQPSDPGPIQVFGILDDGRAYPISPPPDYVAPERLVDGDERIRVGADRVVGLLEALDGGPRALGLVDVPADVDLRDYQLATFSAAGTIGDTAFTLVDRLGVTDAYGINHNIRVGVLEEAGDDIAVRVGSCLQWHGFSGPRLVISQEGGEPIDRMVLSDVVE